jgi:hypothetical protein
MRVKSVTTLLYDLEELRFASATNAHPARLFYLEIVVADSGRKARERINEFANMADMFFDYSAGDGPRA